MIFSGIRYLTRIEDVDRLEHLVRLLNPRISSPIDSPIHQTVLPERCIQSYQSWHKLFCILVSYQIVALCTLSTNVPLYRAFGFKR